MIRSDVQSPYIFYQSISPNRVKTTDPQLPTVIALPIDWQNSSVIKVVCGYVRNESRTDPPNLHSSIAGSWWDNPRGNLTSQRSANPETNPITR